MGFKPFSVPPFETGLEKDRDSFLIPDDAYPEIENAYIFRKRVLRKEGTELIGRISERGYLLYANVLVAGNTTYTNNMPANVSNPLTVIIQIIDTGGPGILHTFTDDGAGVLSDVGNGPGTVSYLSGGAFTINFPALPAPAGQYNVYASAEYYPLRPAMELPTRETIDLNREELLAFDTVKANRYNSATTMFQDISFSSGTSSGYAPVAWPANGQPISWTGADYDFYSTCNTDVQGVRYFWAVNNKFNDGIRYYNGTAGIPNVSGGWGRICPKLNISGNNRYLVTAKLLVPYKGRMLALNTQERNDTTGVNSIYQNRLRYSWVGDPSHADAFLENRGGGGSIDAPTSEQIVTYGFFKDVLIVFCERSVWQVVYSSNEVLPFYWQQINNQFGCESLKSVVQFDKGLFAVGDKAIITTDTVNVERIDLKIPDEVFDFHNDAQGPMRVHGIRDYHNQFVYWTIPTSPENKKFPDKILCLNYVEGAYSYFKDSFTCFGYFQDISDRTWRKMTTKWSEENTSWSSGKSQSDYPAICTGNQQGFIHLFDGRTYGNAVSLAVTGIAQTYPAQITAVNHNLSVGDFVMFESVGGMTEINDKVGKVTSISTSDPTVFYVDIDATGYTPYTTGGLLSIIDGFNIKTKKYNPFYTEGKQVRINYFDVYVNATANSSVDLDVFADDNTSVAMQSFVIPTSYEYGPTIPAEKYWKRVFMDVVGQYIQMRFYLSEGNIRNPDFSIADSAETIFGLHAMTIWLMPSGRLFSYV